MSSLTVNTNRSFSLSFTGDTNASYRVWYSTNLTAWTLLGSATQSVTGVFVYTDAGASNRPVRFYRVGVE